MTNESPHERKLPREQHLQQPQTSIHKPSKKQKIMAEPKKKETLKTVLQFIVSVLTALLATLGVQSCR